MLFAVRQVNRAVVRMVRAAFERNTVLLWTELARKWYEPLEPPTGNYKESSSCSKKRLPRVSSTDVIRSPKFEQKSASSRVCRHD